MTNKKDKKINNRTIIPVMFCFDNNYVIPASVAFLSLLEHANKDYFYKFYVLHSDITLENQTQLKETVEKFSDFSELDFIDMTHEFEELWSSINTKGHFSKEVMYKVLVASIFPQYEKIIVSDVDVVFLGDVSDSYLSFDINDDYYLAGVKPVGKVMSYMENYRPDFTEEEIEKLGSFCGGYLVFNLNKLRQDKMEEKFIKCFEENGNRLNQMEQDVLTLCCYPNIKYLSLAYVACSYIWDMYIDEDDFCNDINYTKEELEDAFNNPIQLHYATSIKPWKNVDATKSEEWFKYIVKTPFLNKYLSELPNKIIVPHKEGVGEIVRLAKNLFIRNISRIYHLIRRVLYEIKLNPLMFFRPSFYIRLMNKLNIKQNDDHVDLLILDDTFPLNNSSFRYYEFITYLYEIRNSIAVMTKNISDVNNRYDCRDKNYKIVKKFIDKNSVFDNRLSTEMIDKKIYLAVCVFLNNIYSNLSILEERKIPFVFTLYPGGGFTLNDKESDEKLNRIFSSHLFKKVIVTQKITYDYILDNDLCPVDKIKFINGVVINNQSIKNKKIRFNFDKDILDVCFVAHKYSEEGRDKGYDIFIDSAKKLFEKHKNIKFHVVGGFSKDDIDISSIEESITFYGVKDPAWFSSFYSDKDIIISPNRPFVLSNGSFDGFPNTCSLEAMQNGVVLFGSDNNNQNIFFKNGYDMVFIENDVNDIVDKVEYYLNKPDELADMSNRSIKSINKHYSYRQQLLPRLKLIKREIKLNVEECNRK